MHANALAIRSATASPDDDISWVIPDRQEIPETGGTAMAHCRSPVVKNRITSVMRAGADGKNSCHPSSLRGESRVAHRVDASVHAMQMRPRHASSHSNLTQPRAA